ncbi:MAG TPA: hypothetical protein V6C95_08730, partial [Coleofasciculaceae cyanobacterium]
MTLLLGLERDPLVARTVRANVAIPEAASAEVFTRDTPQLVQEGLGNYQSGQFVAAVRIWQQAAEAFGIQGDRLNQAMVLSNLALAYHQLGQLDEANGAITTSLQLLQTEPTTSDRLKVLAQALNTQGKLQLAQGQAEQALKTWENSGKTYQQVGDITGVARSLINQAQALRSLGFYQRVHDTLERANQLLQEQPDSAIKAAGLLSFGDSLRLVGDLKKSQEVLEQSLKISQQLQSPPAIMAAWLSLGNTAYALHQGEDAINYYQQVIALGSAPNSAIATSTSAITILQAKLNQLRLFIEMKQWTDAQTLALKIQPQLVNLPATRTAIYAQINFIQSLMKLGNRESEIASRDGEQVAFVSPHPKSFSSGEKDAEILSSAFTPQELAQILATAAQQAKELGDKRVESYALGYLGQIYEQTQQWSEAQSLTEKALVLAQSTNAPDIAYLWQWQRGRLLNAQAGKGNSRAYKSAIAA